MIEGIENVQIELSTGETQIEMSQHIGTENLQKTLNDIGSYTISDQLQSEMTVKNPNSNIRRLFPLFLVFSYLIGLVFISQYDQGWNVMKAMQTFMGGFFIAFSFFKFLDLKGFAYSFSSYDSIAKRWLGYGYLYPFIELILGIAYLTGTSLTLINALTLIVISSGTIGVAKALWQKNDIQCACLGTVFNLPMTQVTLIENSVMIVMAAVMLTGFLF